MKRLLVACMLSVLLIPAAPAPGVADTDMPDHVVHAGATDPTDELSQHMYEGYFPRHLKVHRGDRVRWEFPNRRDIAQAFHTVTFGDADEIPFVRADEAPGTFAFDERAMFTMGCGRPGQPVCVVSSPGQFVSSGTPLQHAPGAGLIQPFDAVIDLPKGTYNYFCTLHHPLMQGTVEVVDDEVGVDNPKPDEFAGQIAALADTANAMFDRLKEPRPPVSAGGRRVWTIDAGARTTTSVPVSTEAFLPASLNIRAGDTVRWVMGGTAHTVTFPDTRVAVPLHLTVNCEFDGAGSGAPGVPAIGTGGVTGKLPWCPPGGTTEMALTDLGANQHRAPDDAVVSPGTVHNSGIMIGGDLPERMRGRPPGSGSYFPAEFEATFPVPGTYPYRCLFHAGFMAGSITVTGA